MLKAVLNEQQLNQLASFLGTLPYANVAQLIEMLKSCVVKETEKNEKE